MLMIYLDVLVRDMSGQIKPSTIKYFIRLKNAVNGKVAPAFEKGIPTKTIFRMVTNSIYAGGVDEKDFRWTDAVSVYNLPAGEYFTWEAITRHSRRLRTVRAELTMYSNMHLLISASTEKLYK